MENTSYINKAQNLIELYSRSLSAISEVETQTVIHNLANAWESPHGAMEVLNVAARDFPLQIASRVVREVVIQWKNRPNYSWSAGGSADHCYLAALCLTGNCAFAEKGLVKKCSSTVLSIYCEEPEYFPYDIVDFNSKRMLLSEFLVKGVKLSIKDVLQEKALEKVCRLILPDFKNINKELIEYFSKHPEDLPRLDWRRFELLLDAVFKNQGYQSEVGPGRGDGGVDLRLIQKDSIGSILTLVQAKRYKPERPIELQAVQALCAVVDDQKAQRGLFVTTSRYLPGVEEFAHRQNGRLILATSADVARWCALAGRK